LVRPIRLLLEKDGKPYGGPVTFHGPALLLAIGKPWDEYVIVDGRRGTDDAEFDEVILTIAFRPNGPEKPLR
jgi:hypothetical protein